MKTDAMEIDEDVVAEADAESAPNGETTKSKRVQSSIGFPYFDLDDGGEVAKAVHELGTRCDWDQLAAKLDNAAKGGGFRLRMLAAKGFGFITYSQGKVSLTALGSQFCDHKQQRAAKATAFLNIELYKAIYDRFRGGVIPPPEGLESTMAEMGVTKKQTGKARQIFERSASQAGFFWSGHDRLVMPAISESVRQDHQEKERPDEKEKKKNDGGGDGGGSNLHPFIQGLLATLPATGTVWSADGRAEWLQAAVSMFNLIYKADPDSGRVEVKVQKQP